MCFPHQIYLFEKRIQSFSKRNIVVCIPQKEAATAMPGSTCLSYEEL